MNDLFHKRNTIYNNIDQFFDPNVQLTFFVYNISSLGPSLHSVNRQRALHKMNTKFQFGTASDVLEVTINRYLFSIAIMCLFLSISRLVFSISRIWMTVIRQLKLILLAIFDKIVGHCSATWQLVVSGWIALILALPCWCGLLWTCGGCFSHLTWFVM